MITIHFAQRETERLVRGRHKPKAPPPPITPGLINVQPRGGWIDQSESTCLQGSTSTVASLVRMGRLESGRWGPEMLISGMSRSCGDGGR